MTVKSFLTIVIFELVLLMIFPSFNLPWMVFIILTLIVMPKQWISLSDNKMNPKKAEIHGSSYTTIIPKEEWDEYYKGKKE